MALQDYQNFVHHAYDGDDDDHDVGDCGHDHDDDLLDDVAPLHSLLQKNLDLSCYWLSQSVNNCKNNKYNKTYLIGCTLNI